MIKSICTKSIKYSNDRIKDKGEIHSSMTMLKSTFWFKLNLVSVSTVLLDLQYNRVTLLQTVTIKILLA